MYERLRVRSALDLSTGKRIHLVLDDEGVIGWWPNESDAVAAVKAIDGDGAMVTVEREGSTDELAHSV